MRAIDAPLSIDFMAVSSYGDGAKSSGIVRIIKDLDIDIKGRDVLIVEDILDSGLTLKYLMANLASRGPASLEVCTFLWKDVEGKQAAIDPKYVGTHCPDAFVVAMAWIMPSITAICLMWAFSNRRFTHSMTDRTDDYARGPVALLAEGGGSGNGNGGPTPPQGVGPTDDGGNRGGNGFGPFGGPEGAGGPRARDGSTLPSPAFCLVTRFGISVAVFVRVISHGARYQ